MVKIRLARGGRINRPIYTVIVTNSRAARDGRFIEKVGQYDPTLEMGLKNIKVDRISHWLKEGAAMSDTVRSLLKKHKIQIA